MLGKLFKGLWPSESALAPANSKFVWIPDSADPMRKQPYYISGADGQTLFFAALSEVHQGLEVDMRGDFVIVTATALQGLIDIHDQKPLVLPPAP